MEIILDEANAETLSEDKVSHILSVPYTRDLSQWSFPISCCVELFQVCNLTALIFVP